MFEMLSHWPERNTFKSLKPIDFPLYKQLIKDPIALDPIMERLDINSSEQVYTIINILLVCCKDWRFKVISRNIKFFHLFAVPNNI